MTDVVVRKIPFTIMQYITHPIGKSESKIIESETVLGRFGRHYTASGRLPWSLTKNELQTVSKRLTQLIIPGHLDLNPQHLFVQIEIS